MTLIQTKDGNTYDLEEHGIRTRDVLISSPNPKHNLKEIEGVNGAIDYGTDLAPRDIKCKYLATASDRVDFSLMRDEIFNIFKSDESFYLIEKRLEGKRWHVKLSNPYQIPQTNIFGFFEVDFIGIDGVSESIKTTADIDKNGLNYGDGWYYGMGLLYDEESHKYTHKSNSFRIYNAGNRPIHPFKQDLTIEISDVVGSAEFLEVKNITNDTHFRVTEKVNDNQKIKIDGPNVTNNGSQFLRSTDKNFIELAPGWNEFKVTGATRAKVSFDFRFYYA